MSMVRISERSCLDRFKSHFLLLSMLAVILLFPGRAVFPAEIKFAWDPNTESDLAGYKVYYGIAPRAYGAPINVGNVTTYTLTGLTSGQTYYITVTAYDTSNNESGYANEISGPPPEDAAHSYTITTSPAWLQFTVDGTTYTSAQTFGWTPGSSHALSVPSPQSEGTGTRYVYSSWSDGKGQSHTITAPSSGTTYTANFRTQNSLITSVNPVGAGTVSPWGVNWYDSGQNVSVSATANAEYRFANWSGDVSGTANPATLTIDGNKTVTSNFSAIPEIISVPTILNGPASGVTGTSYSYTSTGASSNLGHTMEYQFDWKGDGTDTSPWDPSTGSKTWATAGTYQVRTRARCTTHAGVVSNWSSGFAVTIRQPTIPCTVTTSPAGLQVTVDGFDYTAPRTFDWERGSSHTVTITSPQSGGAGVRYAFASWSDGWTQSHRIMAPSSAATYTANLETQYSLTTSSNPSVGGGVIPSGVSWYNSGQSVWVSTAASEGYGFSSWSEDLAGSADPESLTMSGPKTVTANFMEEETVKIQLITGLNLVSFPNISGEISVTDLLSPISGKYEMVLAYDGCDIASPAKMHDPTRPASDNDLQYVNNAMGVWIVATQDAELEIVGIFPSTLTIPLCTGWNLISYAGNTATPIPEALSSIEGKYLLIQTYKAQDASDPFKMFFPTNPASANDLTMLEPGLGYLIYVTEDCALVVNN